MDDTAAPTDFLEAWGKAIDNAYRDDHEHLQDLGWHLSVVRPFHHSWMPLIALRHSHTAIVWIDWALFFLALAQLTKANNAPYEWDDLLQRPRVVEDEEDAWNSLGDDRYILAVCSCGGAGCGDTTAEMQLMGDDLYMGYFIDGLNCALRMTTEQYAFPLPIRLSLKSLFTDFGACLQELRALKSSLPVLDMSGNEPVLPSPPGDGWTVRLKREGTESPIKKRPRWIEDPLTRTILFNEDAPAEEYAPVR